MYRNLSLEVDVLFGDADGELHDLVFLLYKGLLVDDFSEFEVVIHQGEFLDFGERLDGGEVLGMVDGVGWLGEDSSELVDFEGFLGFLAFSHG